MPAPHKLYIIGSKHNQLTRGKLRHYGIHLNPFGDIADHDLLVKTGNVHTMMVICFMLNMST